MMIAMSISAHSDSMNPYWRATAMEYARRLAPSNGMVLAKIAFLWHGAGDYRRALENCDRALEQMRKLDYMKQLPNLLPATRQGLRSEFNEMTAGTDEFTKVLQKFRLDCLQRLGS